jgi:hypothetical protein
MPMNGSPELRGLDSLRRQVLDSLRNPEGLRRDSLPWYEPVEMLAWSPTAPECRHFLRGVAVSVRTLCGTPRGPRISPGWYFKERS